MIRLCRGEWIAFLEPFLLPVGIFRTDGPRHIVGAQIGVGDAQITLGDAQITLGNAQIALGDAQIAVVGAKRLSSTFRWRSSIAFQITFPALPAPPYVPQGMLAKFFPRCRRARPNAFAIIAIALTNSVVTSDAQSLASTDWPQFRGPGAMGLSNVPGVPTSWSDDTNVAWKTALPGPGASSPISVGKPHFPDVLHGIQNLFRRPGRNERSQAPFALPKPCRRKVRVEYHDPRRVARTGKYP